MIRGTTPTHTFKLPFDTAICNKVKVVYAQDDKVLFKKSATDCDISGDTISLGLTQEETLMFDCTKPVQIQLEILTGGGDVLKSLIKLVSVGKCLDGEVFE